MRPSGSSPLPFEWLQTPRSGRGRAHLRESVYLAELRDRAALLYRLRYDRAEAKARLRANVAWDFEMHAAPPFAAKVDGVVDEIYGRGGSSGGPLSL
jgi:hypothetical protein